MIPFDQIRRDYPIDQVASTLLGVTWDKAKSTPTDLWACCPIHQERTPSFHVEGDKWYCHGCGKGGDVVRLIQEAHGVSAVEAARMITGETKPEPRASAPKPVKDPYAGYEFGPAPHDAPALLSGQKTPPIRNPKRGTNPSYMPDDVYPYYDANGELVGYVLRVMIKGEKITPTVLWARAGDWQGWCHASRKDMPLDGLPDLLANPGKQVLVVEGEKCRKAAAAALQGRVVVVSWCGGTNRLDKTDWTPLHGRSLLLWPDHDEGGYRAMADIARLAKPSRVKWVRSYDKEKGADVADLVEEGVDIASYIKANVSEAALVWPKGESDGTHRGDILAGDATADRGGDIPTRSDRHSEGGIDDGGNSHIRTIASGNIPSSVPSRPDASGLEPSGAHQPDIGGSEQNPRGKNQGGVGGGNGIREDAHGTLAHVSADDWQSHLIWNKDGVTMDKSSLLNATLFLQYDSLFKGVFQLNDFSKQIWLMRRPPWESRWDGKRMLKDTDVTAVAGFMETVGLKPKRNDMGAVIERVAEFNRFNPVTDALDALVWDGEPRLQGGVSGKRVYPHMCLRYFGVEDTPINRAFFAKTMIGTVARAYQPGCKVDTVLIFEGTQGKLKSTAIEMMSEALVSGVYTDQVSDPGSKDAGLDIQGRWIIELSELDAFRRADVSQIKAWLSRKTDRFRRPYGKATEEFPRSCVFWGSVNPPNNGYLKDRTGARRFWPVRIEDEIDISLLKEDAPQLWAEAKHLYEAGEQWWLTPEEEEMARPIQMARMEGDPWTGLIDDYLADKTDAIRNTVKVSDIMGPACLAIPPERRASFHSERIEAHLVMVGWRKVGAGVYRRS